MVRENVVPRTGRARFAQHVWTFNVSASYSIILAGFALYIWLSLFTEWRSYHLYSIGSMLTSRVFLINLCPSLCNQVLISIVLIYSLETYYNVLLLVRTFSVNYTDVSHMARS